MSGKKSKIKKAADATLEVGSKVEKSSKAFWGDFKKFITKGNIIDLAVAVVIGAAFNKIVSSLVSSIITPLTGLVMRPGDLSELKWVIEPAVVADEALGIEAAAEVAVTYGLFLQSMIDFLVIAFSIFVALRIIMKFKNTMSRKEAEETAKKAKIEAEAAAEKARIEAEAARIEDEKRKAAAAAESERQLAAQRELIKDVAEQADLLGEIRDIMLRLERLQADGKK